MTVTIMIRRMRRKNVFFVRDQQVQDMASKAPLGNSRYRRTGYSGGARKCKKNVLKRCKGRNMNRERSYERCSCGFPQQQQPFWGGQHTTPLFKVGGKGWKSQDIHQKHAKTNRFSDGALKHLAIFYVLICII